MSSKDIVRTEAKKHGWFRDEAVAAAHGDKRDVFRRDGDTLHVRYDSIGRCRSVRLNGAEQYHDNRPLVLDVLR